MTVTLLRGDALHLPLADHTVDLVVTSPPYFGLRSYQDGGEHYPGQIGSEATPAEWVAAMLAATAEMVRVLKPCGSIWVNLGDKYAGGGGYSPDSPSNVALRKRKIGSSIKTPDLRPGVRDKSLIGLPWRYALACIDQLGLILRAEVIWSKPNGLPESVTDRVRRSHEQWFHFTVQPRYFSAVDEIREAHTRPDIQGKIQRGHDRRVGHGNNGFGFTEDFTRDYNPLGKLPGSVWSIPSQPLTVPPELGVDHFAAFPMEWPRRLVAGWSPSGVCVGCGEGRRPVSHTEYVPLLERRHPPRKVGDSATARPDDGFNAWVANQPRGLRQDTITGYVCACTPYTDQERTGPGRAYVDHSQDGIAGRHGAESNGSNITVAETARQYDFDAWTPPPTTPAVVLDPFGGTGTTAMVAHVMGRHGISVDMSADYTRLAAWRTTDPGELAKAAQMEKPAKQTTGQTSLFEHLEGA